MAHQVKCFYCGQRFDRDKEIAIRIENTKRYAHEKCYNEVHNAELTEAYDLQKLTEYINGLFNYKQLPASVKLRIDKYVAENGYTYKGILQALTYFYEIKHGSKEKANGTIGIVPFIYDDAKAYYAALWMTREQNEGKKIEEYVLPTRVIHIPAPARPIRSVRRRFNFLDDELTEIDQKRIEEVVKSYERKF